jgi:hypothetical protein
MKNPVRKHWHENGIWHCNETYQAKQEENGSDWRSTADEAKTFNYMF